MTRGPRRVGGIDDLVPEIPCCPPGPADPEQSLGHGSPQALRNGINARVSRRCGDGGSALPGRARAGLLVATQTRSHQRRGGRTPQTNPPATKNESALQTTEIPSEDLPFWPSDTRPKLR